MDVDCADDDCVRADVGVKASPAFLMGDIVTGDSEERDITLIKRLLDKAVTTLFCSRIRLVSYLTGLVWRCTHARTRRRRKHGTGHSMLLLPYEASMRQLLLLLGECMVQLYFLFVRLLYLLMTRKHNGQQAITPVQFGRYPL